MDDILGRLIVDCNYLGVRVTNNDVKVISIWYFFSEKRKVDKEISKHWKSLINFLNLIKFKRKKWIRKYFNLQILKIC